MIPDVTQGEHVLALSGVACNCRPAEPQPVAAVVSAGDTTDVSFEVVCQEIGRLAFADRATDSDSLDIYVIDLDGTGRTRLTRGLQAARPRWSPDGSRIAYVVEGGIGVMNADGSGRSMLTHSGEDGAPSWSPDGARLVFASGRDHQTGEIYTIASDGSGLRRLTDDSEEDRDAGWSPDGSRIAFISSLGPLEDGTDIYTMRPDGSEVTSLTGGTDIWYLHTPAWSPDSRYIAYESTFDPVGGLVRGLHILPLNGLPPLYQAPELVDHGVQPAWSPGGSWIAYSGDGGIGVIHPDRTGGHPLTSGIHPDWAPAALVQAPGAGVSGCEAE